MDDDSISSESFVGIQLGEEFKFEDNFFKKFNFKEIINFEFNSKYFTETLIKNYFTDEKNKEFYRRGFVKKNSSHLDQPDYITMLKVYGMIAFQFDIHPMLMTIEVDMQNKREIGNAVCYGLAGNFCCFSLYFAHQKLKYYS